MPPPSSDSDDPAPLGPTVRSDRPAIDPEADTDSDPDALCATVSSGARAPKVPRGTAVGRYLVLGQIGEGGMAAVFSAYDPDLDRKVAIKLLKLDACGDREQRRARLLREAQAVARLSHPNVVAVHDAGSFGDQLFMAMELVEGLTLRDWLAERPRTRAEILRAFVEAGSGLAAAHAAGMVHRDFKPENVLVGVDGRVRVSDFGLARLGEPVAGGDSPREAVAPAGAPEATLAGAVVGTPAYMAPEQFESRPVDARTDQFAFCVALWEALCGERPFAGEEFWTIRRHVLAGSVRPAPRERPLPGWLRAILSRGLSLRPEQRFASLELLLAALRRDRRRRLLRRARAVAAALVLLGGLAAAGASHYEEQTRCTRAAEGLATSLLGGLARAELRPSLERAGLPAAEAAEIGGRFERFLEGWSQAWRQQCELGRADPRRAAPSASCLERAGQRAQATLAALGEPQGAPGIASAFRLTDQLPVASECLRPRPSPGGDTLDPRWADLEETRVLSLIGRDAQAEERLEALLAAAEPAAHAVRAEALRQLSMTSWNGRGLAEPAVARLREAVREADAGGDDEASFSTRAHLADLLSEGLDRREEAERAWLEAEAWLVRLGSPPGLERRLVSGRAHLFSRLGRHDEALALYQRAAALVEMEGLAVTAAAAHINLGAEYNEMGRFREAIAESRRALEWLEANRSRDELDPIIAWGNLAVGELALGRGEAALAACRSGTVLVEALGEENAAGYRVWLELLTAQSLELLGRLDEALVFFERAHAGAATLDSSSHADVLAGKARAELAAGRIDRALELAEESMRLTAVRPWAQGTSVGSRFTLARVLRAAGRDPQRARALAQEALARLAGPEDGFVRGQLEAWLAEEPAGAPAAAR